MKRILSNTFLVLLLCAMAIPCPACTNLIVGKKASTDGSVICSYNCDGFGFAGSMFFVPAAIHDLDEQVAINGWGPRHPGVFVPQIEKTYKVVGLMNQYQVTIVETTFDGRLELVNSEGLFDYFSLMRMTLQRSTSARQAIKVMTDLVEKYGYNSSGETFTICDKEEAWIMEMIGKGPNRKGAVWVALRIPDDCICAHANLSRIRRFPLNDKQNCLYAKDVISFAREMGFYSGKDENFSFRDAYCPIDFENVRYADARVWSFFRHHWGKESTLPSRKSIASDAVFEQIDDYLPYVNGHFDTCDHLPLWIKPEQLLSVRDVQRDMRDHFEGTPLDMTADMSAGPWGMPIRPLPMTYQDSKGNSYFRERPIATQQSGFTMVCQMRSWLPDEVGGVTYFNCDDANMVAYVPVYCGVNQVPAPFRSENNPRSEFSFESAFWMNNWVANMVYPRYSLMIGDLRDAQNELEDYYAQDQDSVVRVAMAMTTGERIEYLTNKSADYADLMMKRWDVLAKFLIVRHNDQVIQASQDGHVVRGQRQTPGYDLQFRDAVGRDTGSRYRLKEVIHRRER